MNPKYHLLIAVAALIMNACSTDDTCPEPVPENEGYKISFTVAEDTETRTTLEMLDAGNFLRWVSTDKVGVYTVGKNENSNTLTTADVSQSPVEFVGTPNQPVSSGDLFYAYYPYNEMQSTDPKAVKLSIPAAQKQTQAGVYNGASHPMVAVPMAFSQEWGNAGHISNVRFRQLGAIVELQLYSSDETLRSESIRSVSFVSDTPLAGDFSFDLTTVTVKDELSIAGYESKVATTLLEEPAAIPAAGGKAASVFLTIAPGQYTGKIVVNTDVAQYTFRLAKAMTFKRAVIKGLPADLAKAERNADAFIQFEDSKVKRICIENWDTNKDGELSYEEAAAVTSIGREFNGTSILNFNELQYFTGLQSIEADAFCDCSSLTSITIPDEVTKIEEWAFMDCSSLTSITIPNGVTSIGTSAFRDCSSLTSITILDGVTAIGSNAFDNCKGLTNIHIPDGVTSIGDEAFSDCSSLTSIYIPKTVTSIGGGVFGGCSSLAAFEGEYASKDHRCLILDGALYAFAPAAREDLTVYTIPDGVTAIGDSVFANWYSLTSINLPDGVTTIGVGAFMGCSSLTSINIPDGVTTIGEFAFGRCGRLTSINIPDGVTTIGVGAFMGCSSLTSIYIPKTVSFIGEQSFEECYSLSAFYGKYASADYCCLIRDGVLLAFAPASLTTEYTIPKGVTSIGDSAFSQCSNLTSIHLPDGVTSIGDEAFWGCGLKSINIPDGVTTIGDEAFWGCGLKSVYCKPTTPPTLGGSAFSKTSSSMKIYVPAASVNAYKTAEGWSEYASRIFADNN